jgi:hypothetical protein
MSESLRPAVEAPKHPEFPMSKRAIWLMCILLTPLCGAFMYYAWRKQHLPAANYANKASWVSWAMWIVLWVLIKSMIHKTVG